MQLLLLFKDYRESLKDSSNESVSLSKILKPFGIEYYLASEELDLCVGMLIDELAQIYKEDDLIDPFDVAKIAWDFDLKSAESFLDTAPELVCNLLKDTIEKRTINA